MANIFDKVQMTQPPRSQFDLTHDVKTSFNFGKLYPCMALMCMPGDKINLSQEAFVRALPMLTPPMHRVRLTFHTFFTPLRLLWEDNHWEKWATNTKVGVLLPAHPYIQIEPDGTNYTELMDHLGLPAPDPTTGQDQQYERVNAMAFAAYQLTVNEYYRDQNLVPEITWELTDSDNSSNADLTTIRKRAWNHDYFTSCLPFAQKGDAVTMPLNFPDVAVRVNSSVFPTGAQMTNLNAPPANLTIVGAVANPVAPADIFAQTSVLSGTGSINDLRTAEALQKWLERAARGGSRYTEWLLSMYGVRSSDARLQRPEYVNGSVTPLLISDVPSTAETATAPQGTLAGYGVARVDGRDSGYYCEEFGIMMTIMSCMPETAYQQGIEKSLWLRFNDPSELPNPLFMNLGEQEVKVREIFAYTDNNDELFGYIPRFAEDRFQSSRVSGQMRTTLNSWHFGRIFANEPALNQAFIECDASYRPFAVTTSDEDHFVCHILNRINSHRPLTKYNNPALT